MTALARGRDGQALVARAVQVAIHPTGATCAQFGTPENYVDYQVHPLDGAALMALGTATTVHHA